MNTGKYSITGAALALLLTALVINLPGENIADPGIPDLYSYHHDIFNKNCCLVISHAGGAVENKLYTNSLEALNINYSIGRRIFELDFMVTSDGKLALTHDWKWNNDIPLTSAGFLECKSCPLNNKNLTPLTSDELLDWLQEYSDVWIITDTKDDFELFIETILEEIPRRILTNHFIFQVYNLENNKQLIKKLPGIQTIFTVYKTGINIDNIDSISAFTNLAGVTMPLNRTSQLLPALREKYPGLPIYIHGRPSEINSQELHNSLFLSGASGFYLD